MIVHGLAACDSCRKALAALRAAGHEARLRDIRETPLTGAEIAAFHAAFGARLVNRRSTTWRGLDAPTRALGPAELVARHPAVMKRPVVQDGDRLALGWPQPVRPAGT